MNFSPGRCTNLTANRKSQDSKNQGRFQPLSQWRMKLVPEQSNEESCGSACFWHEHHKQPSCGLSDGFCAFSHKIENYEALELNKKNQFNKNNQNQAPAGPSKKLTMTGKIRKVLTTTQPSLNSTEAEVLFNKVLNEYAYCQGRSINY